MLSTVTLQSIFWPARKENKLTKTLLTVLTAVVLLSLSAQISIPLQPVPLTFQSITVIAIGLALGIRLGIYTILIYLAAGVLGLPVFANLSGGLPVFLGPTVGYLIGFLPAVAVSGLLAQKGFAKSVLLSFATGLLGTIIIFTLGISLLAQFTGWESAIAVGFKPFMLTEVIKLLLLSLFIPYCWKNGQDKL